MMSQIQNTIAEARALLAQTRAENEAVENRKDIDQIWQWWLQFINWSRPAFKQKQASARRYTQTGHESKDAPELNRILREIDRLDGGSKMLRAIEKVKKFPDDKRANKTIDELMPKLKALHKQAQGLRY